MGRTPGDEGEGLETAQPRHPDGSRRRTGFHPEQAFEAGGPRRSPRGTSPQVACYKVLNSKRSAGVTRCTGDETVGRLRCAPFARPLTGTFRERIYEPPFARPEPCSCRKLLRIPVRAPVITCFPDLESRNFKGLLLISLLRARTRASSSKRGGRPNPRLCEATQIWVPLTASRA
jgi:hypothetical protein